MIVLPWTPNPMTLSFGILSFLNSSQHVLLLLFPLPWTSCKFPIRIIVEAKIGNGISGNGHRQQKAGIWILDSTALAPEFLNCISNTARLAHLEMSKVQFFCLIWKKFYCSLTVLLYNNITTIPLVTQTSKYPSDTSNSPPHLITPFPHHFSLVIYSTITIISLIHGIGIIIIPYIDKDCCFLIRFHGLSFRIPPM